MSKVKPVPDGSPAIMPRLFCRDAVAEIEFCIGALGATEVARRPGPDGKIAHALLGFGDERVMIESEWPALRNRAPQRDGSSSVAIFVYLDDVDRVVERALAAGATLLLPLTNQFWGDRTAWIMDPAGHVWTLATRVEETTEEQRQQRLAQLHAQSRGERAPTPAAPGAG